MRRFQLALFAWMAICSVSTSWAQGLYGAPEVLPVPQQPTVLYATPQYATPQYATPQYATPQYATQYQVYPAQYNGAPAAYQPYPAYPTAQYPQAATRYQASTQYQSYPPYQQYPAAYGRQPVRTAAAPQANAPQPTAVPRPEPMSDSLMPADPMAGQGPCATNQMLSEQQPGCGDNCGNNGICWGNNCCLWYASFSALVLGRSDARRVWTSYDSNDVTNQLTNTQFGMAWSWGGEIDFGRRFCCDCVPYAIEATYWTTDPMSGCRSTVNPGGYVSTPLILQPMMFGAEAAENWFDGAEEHRLSRKDEFHDLEINLIRERLIGSCDSPWDASWLVGVRYFRFREDLTFSSLRQDGSWAVPADVGYLGDTITNNLVGAQIGFDVAYHFGNGLRLFIEPKVGIFNNYLDGTFEARNGAGVNGTGPYGSYPVHATKNGLAFLTQVDLGADWQFAQNWSLRAGYRVVAITGTGLADDQFPQYMVDTPDVANIQHSSSLVLHGAFFGLTYCF